MDKFNTIKLFFYDNKRKIILIICLLLILSIATFLFLRKDKIEYEKLVYENLTTKEDVLENENEIDEISYYYIDIKGNVNNPGVYSLEKGKRVVDAINIAGGLKKDANTSLLNLSRELTDEMVIIIYSNDEVNEYKKTKEEVLLKEEICTEIIVNDACICNDNKNVVVDNISDNNIKKNETDNSNINNNDTESVASEKININKASKEELMTLSKIGESKALAIIEYREKNGLFKKIEDIKNVSGIGDSLFESLKEYITI